MTWVRQWVLRYDIKSIRDKRKTNTWTSLLPLVDLKYNHIYNYFISFETLVKELSIAITLISGHFKSHYDELILTGRGMKAFSGVIEMTCISSVAAVTQLYQWIKTNLFEDFWLSFSPYVNHNSIKILFYKRIAVRSDMRGREDETSGVLFIISPSVLLKICKSICMNYFKFFKF